MGAQSDGLRVSYPGPSMDVYATGYIAPFQNEFVLGHSNTASFPSALVDGFSDWFVDVLFAQGSDQMRVSYGHGSPFVYAQYQNGGAKITFDSTVTLWSGDRLLSWGGTMDYSVRPVQHGPDLADKSL
jgi:endoglucanase Acf2